ncbi:MAG: hypothetical protein JOZ16_01180 [Methylobacteriaceae bacterium]|nr:hypothetical protein [Methylobacteriaceae bacterium]
MTEIAFKYPQTQWIELAAIVNRAGGSVDLFHDRRDQFEMLVDAALFNKRHAKDIRIRTEERKQHWATLSHAADALRNAIDVIGAENVTQFTLFQHFPGDTRPGNFFERLERLTRKAAEMAEPRKGRRSPGKNFPRDFLWNRIAMFWRAGLGLTIGIGNPSCAVDFVSAASAGLLDAHEKASKDAICAVLRKNKDMIEDFAFAPRALDV